MKVKRILLLVLSVLAIRSGYMQFPQANASDDWGRIDGEAHSKAQVISDFIDTAFSETPWKTNAPETPDLNDPETRKRYERAQKYLPWRAEYVYYPDGLPKLGVINKWNREIAVGIDWPAYSKVYASGSPYTQFSISLAPDAAPGEKLPYYLQLFGDGKPKDFSLIKNQVNGLVRKLEKLTGLPVKFIDPSDPIELTENYARIRIVPVLEMGQNNHFKRHRFDPAVERRSYSYNYSLLEHEHEFLAGIEFTPKSRSQVSGYILPNSDNTIGLVVCHLNPLVEEELFKALLTECLVRALGFPDTLPSTQTAVLGEWNSAHASHSAMAALDGLSAIVMDSVEPETLRERAEHFPHKLTDHSKLQFQLSPYDELMISILYCPAIKPGMSKEAVEELLLSKNDLCVGKQKE